VHALNAQLHTSRRVVSDRLFNLLKRRPEQAPWVIFPSVRAALGESSMAGGLAPEVVNTHAAHLPRTAPVGAEGCRHPDKLNAQHFSFEWQLGFLCNLRPKFGFVGYLLLKHKIL
jgi:hypothetical protein